MSKIGVGYLWDIRVNRPRFLSCTFRATICKSQQKKNFDVCTENFINMAVIKYIVNTSETKNILNIRHFLLQEI